MNNLACNPEEVNTAFDRFLEALSHSELAPVGPYRPFTPDGQWCAYASAGEKPDTCRLIFHPEGYGYAKNWHTGREFKHNSENLTPEQIAAIMAEFDATNEATHTEAAQKAVDTWTIAAPAKADHPYLTRKQIKAHGAKATPDNRLMIPMKNLSGEVQTLAFIAANSDKRYLQGGQKKGAFYPLVETDNGPLILAEGFATAASITEALPTDASVYACFDAGNLEPVAKAMRKKYPQKQIIICGDDDAGKSPNTGRIKAQNAAGAVGGVAIFPDEPGDYNDLAVENGLWYVAALLAEQLDQIKPKTARGIFSPIGELLASPQPVDWLVKGWLERDTTAALIAEPGRGKSFAALDMACCVALGRDWHGIPIKQAPVLFLAGEGRMAMVRRAMAWSSFYGDLSNAPLHLSAGAVALNEPDALGIMQAEIDAMPEPPGLLIVDTLQRGLSGDENSAEAMNSFVRALDTLRSRYACTCLVIHHPSKAAPGEPRGHSALKGAIDTMLTIENRDGLVVLNNPKQRGSDPAAPLAFRFSSQLLPKAWDDEDGNPTQSAVLELDEVPDNGAKGRQLSPSLKSALATFHLAKGVNTSCDLEAWRGTFYAKCAAETPGAKKQAFRRARQGLLDAGEIRQDGDLYLTNNVLDLLNDTDD